MGCLAFATYCILRFNLEICLVIGVYQIFHQHLKALTIIR